MSLYHLFTKALFVYFSVNLPSVSVGVASGEPPARPPSASLRIWTTRSCLSDARSASLSPVSSRRTTPSPNWLVSTVTFEHDQEELISVNKTDPDKQETHLVFCLFLKSKPALRLQDATRTKFVIQVVNIQTNKPQHQCNTAFFPSHTETTIYRNSLLRNNEKVPRKPPTPKRKEGYHIS